jgi:predicted nucleotidyltransferase
MKILDEFLDKILSFSKPTSIFLFGSRARNDYLEDSDYEVGILYESKELVSENILRSRISSDKRYRFYPYEIDSFVRGTLDIPFESTIFLRGISLQGKTLRGEKIIESFSPPPITVVGLLREIKFQLGRASDAIVLHKSGESRLASELFYKSCLLGTRDLIILLDKRFPLSYMDIGESAGNLALGEFKDLVNSAYKVRIGAEVNAENLISNVWYLNRFVERQIWQTYRNQGDRILIV